MSDRNIAAAAMHVIIRNMATGKGFVIQTSRTTKISKLKELIQTKNHVKPEGQRLFFAGKQVGYYYQRLVLFLQIRTLVYGVGFV